MVPPVIDFSRPYWRYVGLLGFPVAVIFYRRMVAHHRREPRRTFVDIDLKARLIILNGFAAVLMLAAGCFCVWQIMGSG